MESLYKNAARTFRPLPEDERLTLAWPTPGRALLDDPDQYFAKTRANPDYGKPGWTRECGARFHRGCDIAPVDVTATGEHTTVLFTDCETGSEYESREPVFVPHDPVFCVCGGRVEEACLDEDASDFGLHVVLTHRWPESGARFYTLYGHLAEVAIAAGAEVAGGQRLGIMGATSRIADARNWLAIAPHLHFEVWDEERNAYDPAEFLRRFLA